MTTFPNAPRLLKGGLNPTQAAQSALGTRRF